MRHIPSLSVPAHSDSLIPSVSCLTWQLCCSVEMGMIWFRCSNITELGAVIKLFGKIPQPYTTYAFTIYETSLCNERKTNQSAKSHSGQWPIAVLYTAAEPCFRAHGAWDADVGCVCFVGAAFQTPLSCGMVPILPQVQTPQLWHESVRLYKLCLAMDLTRSSRWTVRSQYHNKTSSPRMPWVSVFRLRH